MNELERLWMKTKNVTGYYSDCYAQMKTEDRKLKKIHI